MYPQTVRTLEGRAGKQREKNNCQANPACEVELEQREREEKSETLSDKDKSSPQ